MMMVLAALFDSFINPGLLLGLFLLSAPIIIHILNKRHYQVINWAAMDFLFQAESRNRRRLRLEDLILLLLRMLVLALLVFAVARPVVRGLGGSREDERVVVLDDSFSMEASEGAGTSFSSARAGAVSQVEDAVGRSIPASVWLGTRPELGPRELLILKGSASLASEPGDESSARAALVDEAARVLGFLRGAEATDLPLRVSRLLQTLASSFEAKKDVVSRTVVLLSDFRASDWFEEGSSSLKSDVAAALSELGKRGVLDKLRWRFVDVGQPSRENVAVTRVRLDNEHPLARVPVRIVVEVKNFGSEERKFLTGELEVGDGNTLDLLPKEKTAKASPFKALHRIPLPRIESVPAGKTVTTEVEFTFEKAGDYPINARLEADRLPRDDSSFLVAHVRDGLRVLVIDGDPGTGRFTGDSGFILPALAPRGSVSSGILPRKVVKEITEGDVKPSDVVMILNREGITREERQVLEAFVRRGGGVAFFLGNRVAPERYRELFDSGEGKASSGETSDDGKLRLFPAALETVKEAPKRARLGISDARHPAFQVFRGVEGSSLEQVGFYRFFALKPAASASVVARFDDAASTPAVLDAAAGKGRVALFNMSADRDWNDWPADPSYPVVLQEWVRYLALRTGEERSLSPGDVLSWETAPGVDYTVVTPAGDALPVSRLSEPASDGNKEPATLSRGASFGATYLAGFYCIIPSLSVPGAAIPRDLLEPRWRALSRDPRESDLEPAGEARLRAALAPAGLDFVMGRDVEVDVFQKVEEGETWRWLALGAAVFLLAELLVAWAFNRR